MNNYPHFRRPKATLRAGKIRKVRSTMSKPTTMQAKLDQYFATLQRVFAADPEFGRRANEHVRAISGHTTIVNYLKNGAPEDEKEQTMVHLLVCYKNKDFTKLRTVTPAAESAEPSDQQLPVAFDTPRVVPEDDDEEATPNTDDDPVEKDDDDEEGHGGDIEDHDEGDDVADPREGQLQEAADEQDTADAVAEDGDVRKALAMLERVISKPKKAQLDEKRVSQILKAEVPGILQTALPGIMQSTSDQIMAAVVTKLEFELAKSRTEVQDLIAKFNRQSLEQAVVEALQSAVGQKIAAGLKSGELEIVPPLLQPDKEYVTNAVSQKIIRAITRKHHLIVSGPSGSGKTYPIEMELRKAGIRYMGPISMSDGLTKKDIIAREWLGVQEGRSVTQWIYGFLPRAMLLGVPLVIDEISQAQKEILTLLYYAMEYGVLHLQEAGEVITAKPGFQIFGTDNALTDTTGLYSGYGLSIALTNRFKFVYSDYMDAISERKVFENHGVQPAVSLRIRMFLDKARDLYRKGVITFAPSTRTGKEIARDMVDGMTIEEAVDYNIAHGLPVADAQKVRDCLKP